MMWSICRELFSKSLKGWHEAITLKLRGKKDRTKSKGFYLTKGGTFLVSFLIKVTIHTSLWLETISPIPLTFDPKISRGHPLLMGNLSGKFHYTRCKTHLCMIKKPFTNKRVVWPWAFDNKSARGHPWLRRNIFGNFHDFRCITYMVMIWKPFSIIRIWPQNL